MNNHPTELPKVAIQSKVLHGKRALVVGIANEHSIAYGCARVFRELGADLAVTYLNEKARPYVEPLAKELGASILVPCDVGREGELEAVFRQIRETWGGLDIALHSIAFAPKEDLQGGLLNCSAEGFAKANMQWITFDELGNCIGSNFMDYLIPSSLEVPSIQIVDHCTPSPLTAFGQKGSGEAGYLGSPAAIASAVNDALATVGASIDSLPMTPEAVWLKINEGKK